MWTTSASGDKLPEPFEGVDADYDLAKKKIINVEKKLNKHL